MTSFEVDPSALAKAAGQLDDCASDVSSAASALQNPDPLMMGLLLTGLVTPAATIVTAGARSLVTGVGKMDSAYASNLRATAAQYRAGEEAGVEAAATIGEV